jgi:hypothetical protein
MPLSLQDAIDQLGASASPKRRSAALRLRRLAQPSAGPAIFHALKVEVLDDRTWETQYQMAMAVGLCGYLPALAWLKEFAGRLPSDSALAVGVGDAIVRLSYAEDGNLASVKWAMGRGRRGLTDGAFRAIAMARLVPPPDLLGEILEFLAPLPPHDGLRFWPAAAAADWPEAVGLRTTLEAWTVLPRSDVAQAAADSLAGVRKEYRPL